MQSLRNLGPHTRAALGTVAFSSFGLPFEHQPWLRKDSMGSGPAPDQKTLALIRTRDTSDEWMDASAVRLSALSREVLRLAQELDQVEQMFRALCAAQEANETEDAARRNLSNARRTD
jgi:hypothetical protein